MLKNTLSLWSDTLAFAGYGSEKFRILVAGATQPNRLTIGVFPEELYEVKRPGTAAALHTLIDTSHYDLILLDTPLPDMDELSLIRWLSSLDDPPYLIVRSKTNEELDRVLALELGADDCVPASCSFREIQARVSARLRRRLNDIQREKRVSTKSGEPLKPQLRFLSWKLDRSKRQLFTPSRQIISLTNAELSILSSLFYSPETTKNRFSLAGYNSKEAESEYTRTLAVLISRLRRKIAKVEHISLIETVRGEGYRLSKPS